MRAAVIESFHGPLPVREVPDPVCPADGVVVSVRACGVCRSDWHAWTGGDPDVVAPHVPGHEFAGVVIEAGSACHVPVGTRVTAPFVLGCGVCEDCQRGEATICDRQDTIGFTQWGAFAERLAIPRADFNVVALPHDLDDAAAAGLGCRVTTAFRALVDRAGLQPQEWVAVHGCGGVGLAAIQIAAALGARPVAVDIREDKLQLARAFGAVAVVNAANEEQAGKPVGDAVRELTSGGAHVSIDALGITATFENSLRSLRKLGRHVQIGMPLHEHASPVLPLLELVYSRQISLYGTRGLPPQRFSALFQWIAEGRLDVSALVTRRIALSEAGSVLDEMNHYEGLGICVIDRFDC
ncbi:MAG: zinc-binding dehydrogenase [Planctomycetales bacterium]|nr:zinc-binding dehydrogenase [Planctomycetales bacterium]